MAKRTLTGSRIRERRIAAGIKQSELARRAGISASYLNLIEHNRRRIRDALLEVLARELGEEAEALREGAGAALIGDLQEAAAGSGEAVELARLEELIGRFPGWARLMAAQQGRIGALERTVEGLNDRLTHDPFLSGSVHEVLSAVSAIRSSASILVQTPEIEPEWRNRFHANIHADSQRLSAVAEAILDYFDKMAQGGSGFSTPLEEAERYIEAHGFRFERIESGEDPEAFVAQGERLSGAAQPLVLTYLRRYARDARQMPLGPFSEAADELGYDPAGLAARWGGDAAAVFRRLVSLPARTGQPEFGLAICDGAGAITCRKPLRGFAVPRFGAACSLWPLYQSLARPGVPLRQALMTTEGETYLAYAVAQPVGQMGFDAPQILEATMLIRRAPKEGELPVVPVGASCRICVQADCAARREPSLMGRKGFQLGASSVGNVPLARNQGRGP